MPPKAVHHWPVIQLVELNQSIEFHFLNRLDQQERRAVLIIEIRK
jgi:hypothetical protein